MFLLSTDTLRGYGLNRIFRFAKEAGYDGLEVALDSRLYDTQNADYLNELRQEYQLPIRVVRTFENASVQRSTVAFELAKKVGAQTVVLEPPRLFDYHYKRWMRSEVPALRKKYGLHIALKNVASEFTWMILPGRSMNNITDLQDFKEVCLDVSNLYAKKIDLMRAYETLKPFMKHVHLSNVYRTQEHSMVDEGIMPVESFLTKLNRESYGSDVSLLVRPKAMEAGDDDKVMRNLKRAKSYYEKYMKS
ncbi:MAG: sugar phosphate isomerase/epimerase [bacterium]|nr:sugar phosphate isomerase/epimerase [bacterium]